MSLIPYNPREGREIVLQHGNAIVVLDRSSQRIEVRGLDRGLDECPTCHRPRRRSPSPEREYDSSRRNHEPYADPEYFRLLRAGHQIEAQAEPPSSPIRRLVEPPQGAESYLRDSPNPFDDTGRRSASPGSSAYVSSGGRIRRDAFSPNYFKTFFVEERELGRGGKGVVLLVRHEIDGCHLGHFACKRVPVGDDHAWLEKVLNEVGPIAKLSHPNLVSYRHVWLEDVTLNRFGPSVACAFILQQYCNSGDLLNYVAGNQPQEATKEELKARMRRRSKGPAERPLGIQPNKQYLELSEIYSLFRDITSGLAYLHDANYVHRDLKPSNCLLHRDGKNLVCLISDFGEVQPENATRKSTGATGTISYCAPEVLKRDALGAFGNFTTKSDIFSLGMILYFMCFGRLPYLNANAIQEELEDVDQLRAEIVGWKGFHYERRERPELPKQLYQLLGRLLSINPSERPSAADVLSVMRSETSLNGVSIPPPPSIGLSNRRIQSLDSPVPPSTPVPDPSKRARVSAVEDEATAYHDSDDDDDDDIPDLTSQLTTSRSLQQRPGSPRFRAPALTASRSHDSYAKQQQQQQPDRDQAIERPALPSSRETPLLMAPPTTLARRLSHQGLVLQHRLTLFWRQSAGLAPFALRLLLFLAKMGSLMQVCWPFTVNWAVGASLITAAALDLAIPGDITTTTSSTTMGRQQNQIEYHSPSSFSTAGGVRWNWKVSSMLAVLHVFVLRAMQWQGMLCAGDREPW